MTNRSARVFLVEDDPASARLLQTLLHQSLTFNVFVTAEDCLAALEDGARPDVFLLDVGLPGLDGYELCRRIKENPACADAPVVFISGQVEIEARLRGYDVGAHDFIIKPFDTREVQNKVDRLLEHIDARRSLAGQVADADTLTTLILSNLDEYAVLVKYLRELNGIGDPDELASATLTLLRGYSLAGAVQLRLPEGELNLDETGGCTPIAVSILRHVRTLDRIFEFRRYGVYNFEHVTLLVSNMPLDDAERCGRLRDHLAIAIETAEARLIGQLATRANLQANTGITRVAERMTQALTSFATRHNHARTSGTAVMRTLKDEMLTAFAHLGLSTLQEESIQDIIDAKILELVALYDTGDATQEALSTLRTELETVLRQLQPKRIATTA